VAILGGEPTLLGDDLIKVVNHSANLGCYTYISTHGRHLTEDYIRRLSQAGVGTVDLAVDSVNYHDGLDKNFRAIERTFELLTRKRRELNFDLKGNIVLTRKNVEDVKELVKIFSTNKVAVAVHVIEGLHGGIEYSYPNSGRKLTNDLLFSRERHEDLDLLDNIVEWLIARKKEGYLLCNPTDYFVAMKRYVHGQNNRWQCLAGYYSLTVRADGNLTPCSCLYSSIGWGNIGDRFPLDKDMLQKTLEICNRQCLSCTRFLHYYYVKHPIKFIKDWYYLMKNYQERRKVLQWK